jgi:hypothetical protein
MRQGYSTELLNEMYGWADQQDGTFKDVVASSIRASLVAAEELDPQNRRMQDQALITQQLPESFGDGDLAERLEWAGRNVDLALFGGYVRSRQPQLLLDPVLQQAIRSESIPVQDLAEVQAFTEATAGGPMNSGWPRTGLVGMDGSALVGPLQLRLEGMYRTAQVIRLTYGDAGVVPSFGAGLGVDWFQSAKFQVTAEGRFTHLDGAPENLIFARPDQVQVAAGVRWLGARDRLTVQLGGMYDLSFQELLARPTASWRFSDHVSAELTGLILTGSTPAPTGVFDAFTFQGGPVSYFQGNDSVALAIQLTP